MKLFGTDGIRGVAGQYPLDTPTVKRIGAAAAQVLKKRAGKKLIILGRDTRESGTKIATLLKKEFTRAGIETWDVGVIPTPGIAYLLKQYPSLAGVVISASHNPYTDNGIKFFGPAGSKLPDHLEATIEKAIHEGDFSSSAAHVQKLHSRQSKLLTEYRAFLKDSFQGGFDLAGMKIVLDCANGATSVAAPELFTSLNAKVATLNADPNGRNINHNSGSLHPEKLAGEVLRRKAACGIAFDGDGDRVIFVDEKGVVRDGDYLLGIAAAHRKQNGTLTNNTLVTTVMANLGLYKAMEKEGINVLKTKVGDRYVYEMMFESGAVVGGEQSGHIIFKEYLSTGDGMLSALQILSVLRSSGKPLSKLCSFLKKYPQMLLNTKVARKVPPEELPLTGKAIAAAEKQLGDNGRVLVRYSGTENLLRVMVEGPTKGAISTIVKNISEVAKKEIELR
jgi:phosphoglucosamine mutase